MCPIAQRRLHAGTHTFLVANVTSALPIGRIYDALPGGASDADFDARWAAWIKRGRAHEQRVWDWFVVCVGTPLVGAAIVHAFLRP